MGNNCHLQFLGPIQIERNGAMVSGFVSRKAVALLGYLAVEARPVSRGYLAQLFWEDKSEARGRGNLSRAINNITQLLPGCLQADYHTVQFDIDTVDNLDLASFQSYLAQATIGDLVRAVMLYRGEFMADLNLLDCPEFDIWLFGQRERYQQQVVQVLQKIIDHYLQRGEYAVANGFVDRLLVITPWREETHRQKMNILARIGQRSAALAQYEICRRMLAEEFEVEPSAETTALIERIKATAVELPHNLPTQATPFMGRETELARVTQRLSDIDCRLLTLVGPGGIGKTRLALQAAQHITQYQFIAFLHGIYFVPLASVKSVDLLASTIADTIDLSLFGASNPTERLLKHLHNKEMLLVLDNFEHLLDGVELVQQILEQAPNIKIITTSRTRLNLRWEWVFEIKGLPFQTTTQDSFSHLRLSSAHFTNDLSALTLFEHIARRAKTDFSISKQNHAIVTRICKLVGGMPLGIELAASRIDTHPCEDIVWGIEKNLDFLTTSLRDIPPRHRSLRAVFDYSWVFLSDEERQVFCRLTVFEGGFEQGAAEQVAKANRKIIDSLVRHSFVQQRNSGRYEIHEYLKQYGYEKLKSSRPNYILTKNQHCTYFTAYLKQRELHLGNQQKESLYQISVEISNIRAAWQWALAQNDIEIILKVIQVFFEFYELKGWFKEGRDTFEHALQGLIGDLSLESFVKTKGFNNDQYLACSRVLSAYSWFAIRLGYLDEGVYLAEQGLVSLQNVDIQESLHDKALLLSIVGMASWQLGNYAYAKESLQRSLEISREINNYFTMMTSLAHLGITAGALGEITRSFELHQECLLMCKQSTELFGVSSELIFLGYVACLSKDYNRAISLLQEGVDLAESIQYTFIVGMGLVYLSYTNLMLEKIEQAVDYCQRALHIFNETEETYGQSLALNYLGHIQWATSKYQESQNSFRSALRIANKTQRHPQALAALFGLALHFNRKNHRHQALELSLYVLTHPAAEFQTKEQAADFLLEQAPHYSLQTVADIEKKLKDQDVETIGRQILEHQTTLDETSTHQ
ncbi:MAG: AAA family ATPase [Anaerolineae bacterium]|nr:AAA family ATPase [Anaerolineae bacterium]